MCIPMAHRQTASNSYAFPILPRTFGAMTCSQHAPLEYTFIGINVYSNGAQTNRKQLVCLSNSAPNVRCNDMQSTRAIGIHIYWHKCVFQWRTDKPQATRMPFQFCPERSLQ